MNAAAVLQEMLGDELFSVAEDVWLKCSQLIYAIAHDIIGILQTPDHPVTNEQAACICTA